MPRVRYISSKRRQAGVVALGLLVMVFVSVITIIGNSRIALADTGPDGTYGGASVDYTLSNTSNVTATRVSIPIYLPGPATNLNIHVIFKDPGSLGAPSYINFAIKDDNSPVPNTYATYNNIINNSTFTIPAAAWGLDSGSGYLRAFLEGNYVGSSNLLFKVTSDNPASKIGYSSATNDSSFAVANTQRCDNDFANDSPGSDMSGCGSATNAGNPVSTWGKHYSYTLPFAPACGVNVPPTSYIDIYDPDNPSNNNDRASIQPDQFNVKIVDTTNPAAHFDIVQGAAATITTYKLTDPAGNPVDESVNKTTARVTFKAQKNHKYTLVLDNVYTNNVLQFRLPYDSIYAGLPCVVVVPTFTNTPNISTSTSTIVAGRTTAVTYFGSVTTAGTVAGNYTATFVHPPNSGANASLGSHPITAGVVSFIDNGPPYSVAANSYPMTVNITVPANTPSGAQYCASLSVTPKNEILPATPAVDTVCITISNVTVPQLIGNGGDVHAGGGVCNNTQCTNCIPSSGTVSTNDQSYGQYVVSADAVINGFGSNNDPGLKSATLGSYGTICRPNLAAGLSSFTGAVYTYAGNAIDMATLSSFAGNNYIVKVNGPFTLNEHGSLTKTVTLLVNGTLTIPNDIRLDSVGSYPANLQPELGIIASGNIDIGFAAHTVQAMLYSTSGTINTCVGTGIQCQSTLAVDGFLMAHDILFNRLGNVVAVATGQPVLAETVTLKPSLYFDPPPLFAGGGSESVLLDLGERPPLY